MKEVLAGLAMLAAFSEKKPFAVRIVVSEDKAGSSSYGKAISARAFHGKTEVGVVNALLREGSLKTLFMSTRYTGSGRNRTPVLLTDEGGEDYSGRGVGKALLNALANEACRRGAKLSSGTDRSDMMESFWKKQLREGRADVRPAAPAYKGDQDYEYVVNTPCQHPGFAGHRRR